MQFGLAIAKILPELKATAKGCPRAPAGGVVGLETFLNGRKEEDEQELEQVYVDAKLIFPYEYIRGCKSLCIPPEWKQYVPHSWPDAEIYFPPEYTSSS